MNRNRRNLSRIRRSGSGSSIRSIVSELLSLKKLLLQGDFIIVGGYYSCVPAPGFYKCRGSS